MKRTSCEVIHRPHSLEENRFGAKLIDGYIFHAMVKQSAHHLINKQSINRIERNGLTFPSSNPMSDFEHMIYSHEHTHNAVIVFSCINLMIRKVHLFHSDKIERHKPSLDTRIIARARPIVEPLLHSLGMKK